MAHKHLHELLSEDQEPFVLQNYIEERRCQLKRSVPRGHLQVKRRKPISENPSFPASFCRNACFSNFHDSPDVRKSPVVDFSSPLRSPCKNSKSLFIHIPSRTASLLLEAALRIQKQPSSSKTNGKALGSGFLGSILKRINLRQRNRKPQIKGNEMSVSVKDILRWDSSDGPKPFSIRRRQDLQAKMEALDGNRVSVVSEMGLSCSCNSTLSSVWSESNEDKSEDLETSTSSRSDEYSEEMEFLVHERKTGDSGSFDEAFCSSPFRFALKMSPSPSPRTPEFGSPATSPIHRIKERVDGSLSCLEKEYDEEAAAEEEEEEEKEQFSPVSVLDPPFDTDVDDDDKQGDDNNSHDGDHRHHQGDYDCEEGEKVELEEEEEEHSYELDRSFAIVNRTKQQLLHRLRRFERLAELNPIELEKRMLEIDDDEEEECDETYGSVSPDEDGEESFVETLYSQFRLCDNQSKGKIPGDMKQLIVDLIAEEERRYDDDDDGVDTEMVVKNVSKKLESWKGVESDTIDMMVDLDLRREGDEWRRYQEQVKEMAIEVELTIFELLVQELSDELVLS